MIGSDVVVRVIEVRGGQVKIGIDAPKETTVHREEVYQRICQENLRAAANAPDGLDEVAKRYVRYDPSSEDRKREGGR